MYRANRLPQPREGTRQRLRRIFGRDAGLGYLMLVPLVIFVIGMLAYPFFYALYLSFTKKMLGQAPIFIGLANYIELLTQDLRFRKVAVNSIVYALSAVALKLFFGMIIALVLNQPIRARGILRGLLFFHNLQPMYYRLFGILLLS